MPLYGHELNDHMDPLCAGLGFAVKLDKEDFIGKSALMQLGEPARVRVGLKATGRGILREDQPIWIDGPPVPPPAPLWKWRSAGATSQRKSSRCPFTNAQSLNKHSIETHF